MELILSDADINWICQRVEAGEYESADAFIAALIEQDMEAAAELAWLQAEVGDGLEPAYDPVDAGQAVREIPEGYSAEPQRTHAERLERLRAEIEKGRASGVSKRSLQDIYEDYMKRRDAA